MPNLTMGIPLRICRRERKSTFHFTILPEKCRLTDMMARLISSNEGTIPLARKKM